MCWGRVHMAFEQLPHKSISIARESLYGRTNMTRSIHLFDLQIHKLLKDGKEKVALNIQFLYENRLLPVFHRSFIRHSWIKELKRREEWCAETVPYWYQVAHSNTNGGLLRELQLISYSRRQIVKWKAKLRYKELLGVVRSKTTPTLWIQYGLWVSCY